MINRIVARSTVAAAGLGAVAMMLAPSAGATPVMAEKGTNDTQVIDCPGRAPAFKPVKLDNGCSTAHQYLTDITWQVWGNDVAVGEGTYHVNNCEPSCAAGTFNTSHAWIVLSDPDSATHLFTKVTTPSQERGQWTTSLFLK
ncbi:hypothetical protein ACFXHA_44705 [Nocardia sp. NPDC059240]|uniref:hypothetical protein n=1 Tax=Nocardia sp. NPDC059240 TaxID=3346786 RepID=UPI0036C8E57E